MHDRVPPWRFAFGNTVESAGVCRALRASRFRSLCRDRVDRPAAAITHCGLDDRGKKDGANRRDYSPGAELVLSSRAPRSLLGKFRAPKKLVIPSRADGEGLLSCRVRYSRKRSRHPKAMPSVSRKRLTGCEVGAPPVVAIPVCAARDDKQARHDVSRGPSTSLGMTVDPSHAAGSLTATWVEYRPPARRDGWQ